MVLEVLVKDYTIKEVDYNGLPTISNSKGIEETAKFIFKHKHCRWIYEEEMR